MAQVAELEVRLRASSDSVAVNQISTDFVKIKTALDKSEACKIILHLDKGAAAVSSLNNELTTVLSKIKVKKLPIKFTLDKETNTDLNTILDTLSKQKKCQLTLHLNTAATKKVFSSEITQIIKDINIKDIELGLADNSEKGVKKIEQNVNDLSVSLDQINRDKKVDIISDSSRKKLINYREVLDEVVQRQNSLKLNNDTNLNNRIQSATINKDDVTQVTVEELEKSTKSLNTILSELNSIDKYNTKIKNETAGYTKNLEDADAQTKAWGQDVKNGNIDFSNLNKYIETANAELTKFNSLSDNSANNSSINDYKEGYQNLKIALANVDTEYERISASVKETTNAIRKNNVETGKNSNTSLQLKNIIYQAREYYDKYSSQIEKNTTLQTQYNALINKLNTNGFNGNITNARIALKNFQDQCYTAGIRTESLASHLKDLFGAHLNTAIAITALHSLQNALRQVYNNVKEIDTAMTELRKTTDETEKVYAQFLDDAGTRAQKLGVSLTDVINATADFTRLGYSLDNSEVLADAAVMYKNVADGIDDIASSTQVLISTMKAFGIQAEDVNKIIDAFNEVGNNYAISSEGIGEALQRSASALSAANNSMEESIGLVVGMNSTVQDADKVGTSLKTVSMYLRAAKTEAEDAGESTDGMANSVSELRSQLLKLTNDQVDIMIDDKTFKSTYQIMKELSRVWDGLTDVDSANILELIGGKRNADAVMSLINNFGDAENAYATAMNSSGSAAKENAKYLDSVEGKLAQVDATYQKLSSDILNSGVVKFALDFLNGVGSGLDGIISSLGLIPSLGAAIGAVLSTQKIGFMQTLSGGNGLETIFSQMNRGIYDNLELPDYTQLTQSISDYNAAVKKTTEDSSYSLVTYFGEANDEITNFQKTCNGATTTVEDYYAAQTKQAKGLSNVSGLIKQYNSLAGNTDAQKAFAEGVSKNNKNLGSFMTSLNGAKGNMGQYAVSLVGATAKTVALEVATTALNAVISMGVSLLISGAINGIMWLINKEQEAIETAKEASDTLEEQVSSLQKYKDEINSLSDKLKDSNIAETDAYDIRSRLLEIQNSLIDQYGQEASGIDLVTGNIREQITALEELEKAEYNKAHRANSGAYESAVNQLENQTLMLMPTRTNTAISRDMIATEEGQDYYDYMLKLLSDNGVKAGANGYELTGDMFTISSSLNSIFDGLQSFMQSNNLTDNMKNAVQNVQNYISEIIKDWSNPMLENDEQLYAQWLKYDSDYSGDYQNIIVRKAELEEAIKRGDQEAILSAQQDFMGAYDGMITKAEDDGANAAAGYVKKYYGTYAESIQQSISSADFINDFKSADGKVKEQIESSISGLSGLTYEQIKGIDNTTLDVLTENEKTAYEVFSDIAASYGITVEQLLSQLASLGYFSGDEFFADATFGINELDTSLISLNDTLTTTSAKQEILQSAFDKIKKGTSLTSDEVRKLKESFPELAKEFTQTADGWTVDSNKIIVASQKMSSEVREKIQEQIEGRQNSINLLQDRSNENSKLGLDNSDYEEEIKKQQQEISNLRLELQMLGITSKETVVSISELQKPFDLLKSVTKEYNETGKITTGTLQSIVNEYPELENAVNQYIYGLKTEKDLFNDLNKCYEEDLDNYKTYLFEKYYSEDTEAWDTFIKNNTIWVEKFKENYVTDLVNQATYKEAVKSLWKDLDDEYDPFYIENTEQKLKDKLTESYGNLFSSASIEELLGNSSSTDEHLEAFKKKLAELQHQLAMNEDGDGKLYTSKQYYLDLQALNEEYFANRIKYESEYKQYQEEVYKGLTSEYSDYIDNTVDGYSTIVDVVQNLADKRIEALEKEKTAIEEKNDEEQRTLDIIEAEIALANAQKKTVMVYKKGQGFVEIQDDKSISDAKKALDDLNKESQIAAIDKEIKSYNDYVKQFTDISSEAEEARKSNKVTSSLGKTESDLLKLDEKDIKSLADEFTSALQSQYEKNNTDEYAPFSYNDLLDMFGITSSTTKTGQLLNAIGVSNPTANSTVAAPTSSNIQSHITYNSGTQNMSVEFNITGTSDPEKVASMVNNQMAILFGKVGLSTK